MRIVRRMPGQKRRRTSRPQTLQRQRLILESLEERALPSTVTWIGGSGDWDTASNWSDGTTKRLPGPADDAVINITGISVTHLTTATDSVHSLTSKAAIVVGAGSLSVASASTISSTLDFDGGTLTGPGVLAVSGLFTW